jgi:hypothetical protein
MSNTKKQNEATATEAANNTVATTQLTAITNNADCTNVKLFLCLRDKLSGKAFNRRSFQGISIKIEDSVTFKNALEFVIDNNIKANFMVMVKSFNNDNLIIEEIKKFNAKNKKEFEEEIKTNIYSNYLPSNYCFNKADNNINFKVLQNDFKKFYIKLMLNDDDMQYIPNAGVILKSKNMLFKSDKELNYITSFRDVNYEYQLAMNISYADNCKNEIFEI